MYKISFVFMIVFCLLAQSLFAKTDNEKGKTINVTQAIRIALQNNHGIKSKKHEISISNSEIKAVKGDFLPKISANYTKNYIDNVRHEGHIDKDYLQQEQDNWSVNVVQTLFAGKTVLNKYKVKQINKELNKIQKDIDERELINDIKVGFYELQNIKSEKQILQDSIEKLKSDLHMVKELHKNKMASEVDVLNIELEINKVRSELKTVENEKNIKKARLNRLINPKYKVSFDHKNNLQNNSKNNELLSFKYYLREAYAKRKELDFIKQNIQIAHKEKDIHLGKMMPEVSLQGGYASRSRDYSSNTVDDQEDLYWSASVNVSWEIFDGGKKYNKSIAEKHRINKYKEVFEEKKDEIYEELYVSYLKVNEASQQIEDTKQEMDTNQKNYRMHKEQFNNRMASISDLLESQNMLTNSKIRHKQAQIKYDIAKTNLKHAIGKNHNY